MKKNIYLLTLLMSLCSFSAFSQTLTLTKKHLNTAINNNDTIKWRFANDHNRYNWEDSLTVTNTTGHSIHVMCKKTERSLVYGVGNDFCWYQCGDSSVYILGPMDISGNSSNDEFSSHYNPNGLSGTSLIRYTFYLDGNPSDSICFNILFIHPPDIGINEISNNYLFANAYPNPANNFTTFNYSFSANVKQANIIVSDLLGKVVLNIPLSNKEGKINMDTKNLSNGIYIYSLQFNGKNVNTKKLLINH